MQITEEQMQACMDSAPELINHLYSRVVQLSQSESKLNEEQAKRLGLALTKTIAEDFGGELIYIPKGMLIKLTGRDWAIFNEFNGKNHHELAKKYNVSVVWLYKIIKRMNKLYAKSQQYDLFEKAA